MCISELEVGVWWEKGTYFFCYVSHEDINCSSEICNLNLNKEAFILNSRLGQRDGLTFCHDFFFFFVQSYKFCLPSPSHKCLFVSRGPLFLLLFHFAFLTFTATSAPYNLFSSPCYQVSTVLSLSDRYKAKAQAQAQAQAADESIITSAKWLSTMYILLIQV